MNAARTTPRRRHSAGITLLEVMISCGLLMVGLSTIAALLPAAGSRLSQATAEDRAAVLLANAAAEIFNRGLIAADAFATSGTGRMLAIGKVLGTLPGLGDLPGGRQAADIFREPSAEGSRRCGSTRTFLLEDALEYDPPRASDTPVNAFFRDQAGFGPRKFHQGMCWGATLAPDSLPAVAGGRALVAIAVFKREEGGGGVGSGVPFALKRAGSYYEADVVATDSLVRGCSWLLAIPADAALAPRWFRVMSSWNWRTAAGQTRRVILRNQEDFETLTNTAATGATATVIAFEGIVRLDEQVVTLN